jgi:excisionase family DNA binding protein
MNVAIYILASDDKDTNLYRLKLLVERIKSECRQYKIFSEIVDEKGNQPLKKELISRVCRKEFDTILTYKLSEWSGSMDQLLIELNELNVNGIRFISYFENYDSSTLTGKLYIQILSAVNDCELLNDPEIKEIDISNIKSIEQHHHMPNKTERIITDEGPAGLNYFGRRTPSEKTTSSGNELNPGLTVIGGKNSDKAENFDLIGLTDACRLTGYSKFTIYQLTSRKLIPHYKRPHGRRIFFSKKALEEWILTGKI